MKNEIGAVALALAAMSPLVACAADPQAAVHAVQAQADIALPAADAWARLGRFCAIKNWQSLVAACDVVERENGLFRVVVMRDNAAFVERLEDFSDSEMHFSYSMASGPLPVKAYRATFRIEPVDAAHARIELKAEYTADAAQVIAVDQALRTLFENGLKGMKALLATSPDATKVATTGMTPTKKD
jgi:hypothetical protein